MKKLLIVLLASFGLMLRVKADMSAPMIKPYEAVVTNPNGAYVYVWNGDKGSYQPTKEKFQFEDKIKVEFEYDDFAIVGDKFIRIADISAIEAELKLSDLNLNEPVNALILKDISIYKGPSLAYDKTNVTLKTGTKLDIQILGDGMNPWAYVEYLGTKGFISILDANVAYQSWTHKLMTVENTKMTDKDGNTILTIAPNTEITKDVYQVDPWTGGYYITYQNQSGFIMEGSVATDYVFAKMKLTKEMNIHEKMDTNSEVLGKVLKDTILIPKYQYFNYDEQALYIEQDNIKGWVINNLEDGNFFERVELTEIEEKELEKEREQEEKEEQEVKEEEKEEQRPQENKPKNLSSFIITCVSIAVIVSLTALVTIILINKKK